ncbi:DUF2024 family protein [Flagellimonas flava]|uniref:DUF2024 family protein n=1 Tax=Flagellimonas flava TaxID=570519 RepID=UPI003D645C94
MKIAVWDTYVEREDGITMHFDILVPKELTDEGRIFLYGQQYLETKTFKTGTLTSNECRFCHIQSVQTEVEDEIRTKGYFIVEMENCS